ncbi:hypothetical protein PP707_06910 [Acetobacter pasteurianus]|nr:hypothetical protein [Acetobacter pasteurianus]
MITNKKKNKKQKTTSRLQQPLIRAAQVPHTRCGEKHCNVKRDFQPNTTATAATAAIGGGGSISSIGIIVN